MEEESKEIFISITSLEFGTEELKIRSELLYETKLLEEV